ncbi:MAG: hypothetical protein SNJ78_07945 [Spirochaetales bacterium]
MIRKVFSRVYPLIILCILLGTSAFTKLKPLYAETVFQEESPTEETKVALPVEEVKIKGLGKTKPSVLKPYTDPLIGKPFTPLVREQLIQNLRSLGIFHSIQAYSYPNGNGGSVLQIEVKEKWTLVPIPLGGASSGGSFYGGLLLFESNLLGYNKKFFGGAILSESAWKVMTGYIDPRLFQSDTVLFLGFNGSVDQLQYRTVSGDLIRRYEKTSFDVISEVAFPLLGKLSLGLGMLFYEQQVDPSYEGAFNSPSSGRYLSPTLGLRYQNSYYGPILVYGTFGNVRYEQGWEIGKDTFYGRASISLQAFQPVGENHRFGWLLQAQAMPEGPSVLFRKVSGRFLKTLPENLYSDTILSSQLVAEAVPFTFSWGAPTLVLFYETGGFRQEESSSFLWTHGPGAGFRIYLSKVAVPAFGFDFAYSVYTGQFYGFVNVGLQM